MSWFARRLSLTVMTAVGFQLGCIHFANGLAGLVASTAPAAHGTLAMFLDIPSRENLEPNDRTAVVANVEAAWLLKYPIGTPLETILAEIPEPEGRIFAIPGSYVPWSWELADGRLTIHSEVSPVSFAFTCRGEIEIAARFEDGVLFDVDVSYPIGCL